MRGRSTSERDVSKMGQNMINPVRFPRSSVGLAPTMKNWHETKKHTNTVGMGVLKAPLNMSFLDKSIITIKYMANLIHLDTLYYKHP